MWRGLVVVGALVAGLGVAAAPASAQVAPRIQIISPESGTPQYARNQTVNASYSCQPFDHWVSCQGAVGATDVDNGSPLPTGTLGTFTFVVTAEDESGATTTASRTYRVYDGTAPTITITTPAASASYVQNQSVAASYSCGDEAGGSGIASCTATVGGVPVSNGGALDTSTVGQKTLTVTARDGDGNQTQLSRSYVVADATKPTVTITSPADDATFTQDAVVLADYACADEAGGSGLADCDGTTPDGSAIDTSTLGIHDFTVSAEDYWGNQRFVLHEYTVVNAAPTVTISNPADGAVITRGRTVLADYSCADDSPGSLSCTGDVADGAALDTDDLGPHTLTVTAVDPRGNTTTVTNDYVVVAPRCAGRAVTVMLSMGERPTAGADVILGRPGADSINAGRGNDVICTLGGNDLVRGAAGADRIDLGAGADTGYGLDGADTLIGGAGADVLEGGNGDDLLNGGTQRDTCRGQAGRRDRQVSCEVRTGFP
jgi:Ca2+-binding RTX toxin-like protein